MKKYLYFLIALVFCFGIFCGAGTLSVRAESLNDEIDEQIEKMDLTDIEKFYSELDIEYQNFDFIDSVYNMLSGKYEIDYSSVFSYIFQVFFSNINQLLPSFLSLLAIGVLCGVIQNVKGKMLTGSISETIFLVCYLSEITISFGVIISIWTSVSQAISDICKFSEVISPILLTLMVASGGSVSATIFKPAVVFFSNGVSNLINVVILPLIAVMFIFNVISQMSDQVKFNKFADSIASTIKWILGLVFLVMGLFLTVQGIAGGVFDGISFKATKYAISNSIPIVGGFLKDSFDLVAAGSVLIKNAIGVAGILGIFYLIISPLLFIASASILFKFCSSLLEPITDSRMSNYTASISKTLTYLSAVLMIVGVMFFINVILLIVCGNTALV